MDVAREIIGQALAVKLDRSDATITLANINKDVCSLLAAWELDVA